MLGNFSGRLFDRQGNTEFCAYANQSPYINASAVFLHYAIGDR